MENKIIAFVGILLTFTGCVADYCLTYYAPGSQTFYYQYCSAGCCGASTDQYCCSEAPVGTIVGAVLGCLLAIGILCAIVACCMIAAKGRAKKEQMAREQELDNNTMVAYHGANPTDIPRFNDPATNFHPPPGPIQSVPLGGATGGIAPVDGAVVSMDALPPKY